MIKMWKQKLYSPQIVNTGRQSEIDIAKFLMIFCLPFIHCIIECTPEEGLATGIPYVFDTIIGGPLSAPLYMFAMGVGMVYTKYRSVQYYAIRGLKLGLMSYVFNICRFLIPFLVGFAITGDSEKYIEPLLFRTLGNDILQFAALAFLAMALMEKLKVPNFGRLAIGVLCSIVANFFNGISVGSDLGNIFLGYFVGTESPGGDPWIYSDFPLLNWIIVPICGYLFGTCLQHIKNKNLFYGIFSPICGVFAAVYFTLGIIFKFGMFGDGQNCYYHISTIDVIVSLAAAVGVIGLFYLIAKKLPQKIIAFCVTVSRNINSVYCIHWVLVSWITIVLLYVINGTSYFPVGYTMLISLGISIASILLAKLWVSQIKPFLKGRGKGARV